MATGRVIVVETDLLKSEPFRKLSNTAIVIYFDFRMKCKIGKTKPKPSRAAERVIENNGDLEYCYSTAEKNGITRPRFVRAITELVNKGFIDIARYGSGGRKGDKNKYAISERWRYWGTPDFIKKEREKDTRKGRGWAVYHFKKSANISNVDVTRNSLWSNENVT